MWETITGPWPWYVSGPLLGLMVPLLLFGGNRRFGISSTLRHACAAVFRPRAEYFRYDWKQYRWNMTLALGVVLGAALAVLFLGGNRAPSVSPAALELFASWGVAAPQSLQPAEIFGVQGALSAPALISLIGGGFLVGFGTRWGGGCTSGHAIMGISQLSPASMLATFGFFGGGALVSNFVVPLVMGL